MPKEAFELDVSAQQTSLSPRSKRLKNQSESGAPWQYLGLIGEIGFAIALPIAGGALLGVFIDGTLGSSPKATLSLLFLGVVVSFANFIKSIKTIVR